MISILSLDSLVVRTLTAVTIRDGAFAFVDGCSLLLLLTKLFLERSGTVRSLRVANLHLGRGDDIRARLKHIIDDYHLVSGHLHQHLDDERYYIHSK